jgi:hypothetical protein
MLNGPKTLKENNELYHQFQTGTVWIETTALNHGTHVYIFNTLHKILYYNRKLEV